MTTANGRNNNTLITRMEFFEAMMDAGTFSRAAERVAFKLLFKHLNGSTGRCDPAIATLVKETGLSERSVVRAIGELEETGWWIVGRNEGTAGRGGRPNTYRPNFERGDNPVTPSDPKEVTDVSPLQGERGDIFVPKGVTQLCHPNQERKNQEDSHRVRVSGFFERFVGVYPSRGEWPNPTKPAQAEFEAALMAGADPEAIIAGAERYAAHVTKEGVEPRFVAQAVTWLAERRWTDRARPVEAPPKRYGMGLF